MTHNAVYAKAPPGSRRIRASMIRWIARVTVSLAGSHSSTALGIVMLLASVERKHKAQSFPAQHHSFHHAWPPEHGPLDLPIVGLLPRGPPDRLYVHVAQRLPVKLPRGVRSESVCPGAPSCPC